MSEETSIDRVKDVNRCLVGKVISYKKVNIEAFKGLIEQIWSPFGQVEVESVGDNLFIFYFNNGEDRNRVLQRGPWHFGNSLIVLEKSTEEGNVSKLGFNCTDFWVQIHDILILCMNRRTAKWLAEQIGEVVEIPSESRECQTDEVTLVSLKYEKLPDFCYACGRIGHGMKECLDEEARKMALEGPLTRFGSWLKATAPNKSKPRFNSQGLVVIREKNLHKAMERGNACKRKVMFDQSDIDNRSSKKGKASIPKTEAMISVEPVGEPINNSAKEEKELFNVDHTPPHAYPPINNPSAAEEEEVTMDYPPPHAPNPPSAEEEEVTMDYSPPRTNHPPSAEEDELNVDYSPPRAHPSVNNTPAVEEELNVGYTPQHAHPSINNPPKA
ncbi:hypothetical protein EZV62_000509 [Acer yangbiense]|uniref:CCHC-type domain-containing protein n=1 Tax=Acer yangbiense TaxID=1000413 RepID=A0A5C7IRI6_9ROSI|nr:hypothetical protein EZV62_000509 [Acer yangbiense]